MVSLCKEHHVKGQMLTEGRQTKTLGECYLQAKDPLRPPDVRGKYETDLP